MERVRFIVHKQYFDEVLSALQDIGVVQIETLPESATALLSTGEPLDYGETSSLAQRFRGLESLLYPQPVTKKVLFSNIADLKKDADAIKIDERVTNIRKELDYLDAETKDADARLQLLAKMDGSDGDLSVLSSQSIVSFVAEGHVKQLDGFADALRQALPGRLVETRLKRVIIFSIRRGDEKDFGQPAEKFKVRIESVPQMTGTVAHNRKHMEDRSMIAEGKRRALEAELFSISQRYYSLVSALREQLDLEMVKFEVANKLGLTKSIAVFEGWMPEESLHRVRKLLRGITKDRIVIDIVHTKEEPPTLMKNPVTFKLFESFIRFYSLPKTDEIDPTIIFAVAFPVFFGFMVGDGGYGLFMLGLSLWLLHRVNHPPKKSHIPKPISSFISTIVSPNGLRILAKSIIPGSIIAIILGAVFNEWFGFQLPYTALFNVTAGLSTLLVLAGWIGVFMVSLGFVLGFLNKLAIGEKKHAIAKLGWLAAAIGFVILGLNVLHKADLGVGNPVALLSYALLAGGIITIVKCEGANAIMELPSLISHMLSYTRLVGILLASIILAEVIDLIFISSWHHSILLGIIGTIILIVGQLFNIVIALFEPGIQGARLIYVEFFSKFFEGNGKPFKPLLSERQRTLSRFKLPE
jgi:V/A-type H+-transporting ATPase subunit I